MTASTTGADSTGVSILTVGVSTAGASIIDVSIGAVSTGAASTGAITSAGASTIGVLSIMGAVSTGATGWLAQLELPLGPLKGPLSPLELLQQLEQSLLKHTQLGQFRLLELLQEQLRLALLQLGKFL